MAVGCPVMLQFESAWKTEASGEGARGDFLYFGAHGFPDWRMGTRLFSMSLAFSLQARTSNTLIYFANRADEPRSIS